MSPATAQIIFVPVKFVPPDWHTQQALTFYVGVPVGSDPDQIRERARRDLADFLLSGRQSGDNPYAPLDEYQIEILPITAMPRP